VGSGQRQRCRAGRLCGVLLMDRHRPQRGPRLRCCAASPAPELSPSSSSSARLPTIIRPCRHRAEHVGVGALSRGRRPRRLCGLLWAERSRSGVSEMPTRVLSFTPSTSRAESGLAPRASFSARRTGAVSRQPEERSRCCLETASPETPGRRRCKTSFQRTQ